jgi:Uncharacterized protein conserved in bacteria
VIRRRNRTEFDHGHHLAVGFTENLALFEVPLSSVVFDQRSGHLLLLSDESKLLIEMTDVGKVVSFRSLATGFAGLQKGIPQAEGVTTDTDGYLYIVSEPNLGGCRS